MSNKINCQTENFQQLKKSHPNLLKISQEIYCGIYQKQAYKQLLFFLYTGVYHPNKTE